ncbi:hypothetical protein [Bacillus pseudomycoides]|uniref:hypothetical protein n=1 Tax=Bacillus pseudomycoides TaxID=64104 RepID=UPI003D64E2B9
MIQIKRDNLHDLAQRHYIDFFQKKGFLKKLKEIKDSETEPQQKSFFQLLYKRIRDIITGKPESLSEIIKEIYSTHKAVLKKIEYCEKLKNKKKKAENRFEKSVKEYDVLFKKGAIQEEQDIARVNKEKAHKILQLIERYVYESTQLLKKINKVFNYKDFCTIGEDWGAYELVKQLNVSVCPYCNRQFISIAEPVKGEKGRTRPQLDHFYSKSKYPFLAVSFFNLIPCCYVCNANLKRNQEFTRETHIHPYETEFGDLVQFTVKFQTGKGKLDYVKSWYSSPELLSIELKLNQLEKRQYTRNELKNILQKINNNKKVFKLRSLYNLHRDYIGEIVLKSMMYNDAKIDTLHHEFPRLFPTKESVVRLIYSNYTNSFEWDKRILSKLTHDIIQEYGIRDT